VPEDSRGMFSTMIGELCPFRPWKRYGKDRKNPREVDRLYVPEPGTPEFHAAECVHLARRYDVPGKLLGEQRFPPEAIRHLRLAAGEPKAKATKPEAPPPADGVADEEKALALLVAHPDWPETKIAGNVPCDHRTLYKWPRYRNARQALKAIRNDHPHGSKDDKTGDVEAWDEA